MILRKVVSLVGIKLPFSESIKDALAKKIPIPTVIDDWTKYKTITNESFEAEINDDSKTVIGWSLSRRGNIIDYYGKEVPVETSIIVFLPEQNEVFDLIAKNRRAFFTQFSHIGTGRIPTCWSVDEGHHATNSWTAWIRYRPQDRFGNFTTDSNDKLIDTTLAIKIYNPYFYQANERNSSKYAQELVQLYQELLRRNEYYKKNILF